LWVVQAGTAVSRRTRAGVPNSVNLLRWGGHCLIERWDFDHHTQAFAPALVTVVQPDRAGANPRQKLFHYLDPLVLVR
jgi:hypothetical protein